MLDTSSEDYYCAGCAIWLSAQEVEAFNEANDPDGDGPELCPDCGGGLLWWAWPEAQQYMTGERAQGEE